MKKPRVFRPGVTHPESIILVLVIMPFAVLIGVIGIVLMPLSAGTRRAAAIGTVVGVADGVTDQATCHTAHRGADDAVRRQPTDQRTRTGAQHRFGPRVIVAGSRGGNRA